MLSARSGNVRGMYATETDALVATASSVPNSSSPTFDQMDEQSRPRKTECVHFNDPGNSRCHLIIGGSDGGVSSHKT